MTGKNLIEKNVGNCFWSYDMKSKNARGKKHSFAKAEAKRASRAIRYDKSFMKEVV